jgi:hypothetical protein
VADTDMSTHSQLTLAGNIGLVPTCTQESRLPSQVGNNEQTRSVMTVHSILLWADSRRDSGQDLSAEKCHPLLMSDRMAL